MGFKNLEKLVIKKNGVEHKIKLVTKKTFIFDCPGYSDYTKKCNLSNEECIYAKEGKEKKYCAFYNFYLLSKGRYSV